MAANVLNSKRAVEVSIFVVRTFVRLREIMANNKNIARKLEALEGKYDDQFRILFEAIHQGSADGLFGYAGFFCPENLSQVMS